MPDRHAVLSASGAHRWLACSPSARLELEFENTGSAAASEGTCAHALCEYKLKSALGMECEDPRENLDYYNAEMEGYTDDYAAFVMEKLAETKQTCTDPIVLVEQHLDFSCYVPDGFGTGDALIIGDGRLHIIDFKYGMGVLVEAEQNPQMMLYGLGALLLYDSLYDVDEVCLTIFQPRRENVSTWSISADELRSWAELELKPKAQMAFDGTGEYTPGPHCQFCRAAVKCRARADDKLKLAESEFKMPPLLTDAEIEDILDKLPELTKWAEEIMAYATDAAVNHGKQWRNHKVVEGRTVRKYKDEEAVAAVAQAHGYTDIWRHSLITMTEMQRLMGKAKFEELLGGLVIKPRGKPALVPISDKRPAMNVSDVKNEFNVLTEENYHE